MNYNSMYYWANFLEKDMDQSIRIDSYILNINIVNQNSNVVFYKWYSFHSREELLGFIKFVALPSGYYSKLFGEKEDDLAVGAETYEGAIDLLYNNIIRVDEDLIKDFQEDYSMIGELEEEFSLEQLDELCKSFNAHLGYNKGVVFSHIQVYKNVKDLGRRLIKEYEDKGMTGELEKQMGLSKEQIIDMFSGIENNPFMLKRLNRFLSNKFML